MNSPTDDPPAPPNGAKPGSRERASRIPRDFIVHSLALILLAVGPAILCAWLAQSSGSWQMFERSGSIITIVGLLLASRRYIEHSVTDLVRERASEYARFKPRTMLGDILDARRGLTLSAFGTLIWGWGAYLRWWSFAVLAMWMAFVFYRAFQDPLLQRRRAMPSRTTETASEAPCHRRELGCRECRP
jgi:Na+/melibiose symporter-like transporter